MKATLNHVTSYYSVEDSKGKEYKVIEDEDTNIGYTDFSILYGEGPDEDEEVDDERLKQRILKAIENV